MQAAPPEGRVVHIIQRNVTLRGPGYSGMTGNSALGHWHGHGHRRMQAKTCGNLNARAADVTQICCDEPTEDCTSGSPASCNAGCAAIFLPFWTDCGDLLDTMQGHYALFAATAASLAARGIAARPTAARPCRHCAG